MGKDSGGERREVGGRVFAPFAALRCVFPRFSAREADGFRRRTALRPRGRKRRTPARNESRRARLSCFTPDAIAPRPGGRKRLGLKRPERSATGASDTLLSLRSGERTGRDWPRSSIILPLSARWSTRRTPSSRSTTACGGLSGTRALSLTMRPSSSCSGLR